MQILVACRRHGKIGQVEICPMPRAELARIKRAMADWAPWCCADETITRPADYDARWRQWRQDALAALPLDAIYGPWLTGRPARGGWYPCRDPDSPSGDRHPSARVSDGSGGERGWYYSFRGGRSLSVFDFCVEYLGAADYRTARDWISELSGVPLPR